MNKKINKICTVICIAITVIMLGLVVFGILGKSNHNIPVDVTQLNSPAMTTTNENSEINETKKVPVVIPNIIESNMPGKDKPDIDVGDMKRDPEPGLVDGSIEYDTKD